MQQRKECKDVRRFASVTLRGVVPVTRERERHLWKGLVHVGGGGNSYCDADFFIFVTHVLSSVAVGGPRRDKMQHLVQFRMNYNMNSLKFDLSL